MSSGVHSSSTIISKVYKSRKNILKQLKQRGYDISNYDEFSINEVHIMYNKEQLDMIVENEQSHKIYIKYHIHKKMSPNHIYTIISDLFDMENLLNRETDEIIFISNDDPNDSLIQTINQVYFNEKTFINIINIRRLQFNILDHELVPTHRILTNEEMNTFMEKYNIHEDSKFEQLPTISRFDPVAVAIGLKPGIICEIIRPSKTAIQTKYYRICK
jgi:DNA-directed RNA polymerase subunit H